VGKNVVDKFLDKKKKFFQAEKPFRMSFQRFREGKKKKKDA